jgi:hypothetical protein
VRRVSCEEKVVLNFAQHFKSYIRGLIGTSRVGETFHFLYVAFWRFNWGSPYFMMIVVQYFDIFVNFWPICQKY